MTFPVHDKGPTRGLNGMQTTSKEMLSKSHDSGSYDRAKYLKQTSDNLSRGTPKAPRASDIQQIAGETKFSKGGTWLKMG